MISAGAVRGTGKGPRSVIGPLLDTVVAIGDSGTARGGRMGGGRAGGHRRLMRGPTTAGGTLMTAAEITAGSRGTGTGAAAVMKAGEICRDETAEMGGTAETLATCGMARRL